MGGSGGGGGGFFYGKVDPASLVDHLRQSEKSTRNEAFDIQVNEMLGNVLGEANNRDAQAIQAILNKVKQELSKDFPDSVSLLFGGSVAKNTYVEGLSDVDALILIDPSQLEGESPAEIRHSFAERLKTRFGPDKVFEGTLAVTLKVDNSEVQLLPAIRSGEGFKISDPGATTWSQIRPRKFAEMLTNKNQELDGRLIPTIKLVKSIIGELPEQQRLTGYHCEALAVKVFDGYSGERQPKAMVRYFFEKAAPQLQTPIKDSTGQSTHVDDYLGESNSLSRRIAIDALSRIGRKMANADAASSLELWKEILGNP